MFKLEHWFSFGGLPSGSAYPFGISGQFPDLLHIQFGLHSINNCWQMLSLICLFFCIIKCSAIFGGIHLLLQDHPYFVVVRVRTNQTIYCAGTVVDEDVVGTAAQCLFTIHSNSWVENRAIDVLKSDFKYDFWLRKAETYSCEQFNPHEAFRPLSRRAPFNVALIQLKKCIGLA